MRSNSRRTIVLVSTVGLLAALCVAAPTPASAGGSTVIQQPFACTGDPETWTVPAGVTSISVDVFGAQGGTGKQALWAPELGEQASPSPVGGRGGRSTFTAAVDPGDEIDVVVGCRGGDGSVTVFPTDDSDSEPGGGGFGAGEGGTGFSALAAFNDGGNFVVAAAAGGGGGASSVTGDDFTIVAGGGGGSGGGAVAVLAGSPQSGQFAAAGSGGRGGGTAGENGANGVGTAPGVGGGAGTDSSPGSGGAVAGQNADGITGGDGSTSGCSGRGVAAGGGGGGGWNGGGGGGSPASTEVSQCAAYVAQGGGGGGGGGAGFGPAGTIFEVGAREDDGLVTITYNAPAPTDQPDAQVRKGTSLPFVGNDVYPPAEQKVTTPFPGGSQTFQVKVENDGSSPDRFRIRGSAGVAGIVVKYKVGSTNVTSAVLAGSYQTPVLAPGASVTVTFNVTVAKSVPVGTRHAFTVRATSRNTPTSFDAATGIVKKI